MVISYRETLTNQINKLTLISSFKLGHACMLSHFSSLQLFVTPWTVAYQAPLSKGFSRQEYWSGLPCPPPGDLPDPGIELVSLMSPALGGGFFATSATWEAQENGTDALICRAEIETRYRDVENQRLDTRGVWDELGDWD